MTKLENRIKQPEPNFTDGNWYLSTNKIWHKVQKDKYLVCIKAIGKVQREPFDVDQAERLCRNCIHILVNRRNK